MLASKKTRRGIIGAVALAGVLGLTGFALTTSATWTNATVAVEGAKTPLAVNVTSIDYLELDGGNTDPSTVEKFVVVFDKDIPDLNRVAYITWDNGTTWTTAAQVGWTDSDNTDADATLNDTATFTPTSSVAASAITDVKVVAYAG